MTRVHGVALPDEVRLAGADLSIVVTEATQLTGGRAARTYRVTGRRAVTGPQEVAILRVQDKGGPTAGVALSIRQHYELLSALATYKLPAPRPIGTGRLATGEYLMTELIDGDVPSPWSRRGRGVLSAEPLRTRLPQEGAALLRAIHAAPVRVLSGVDGPFTVRPADELQRWRAVLESTTFWDDPLVRWCLFLLERDLPESVPAALVHGDFRLGNLVVRGGSLVGVLDWELATIGDPALDLALLAAPPVAADWDRCGLDPVSTLIDSYLEGRPDEEAVRRRLPALTLLATLKIVSLWANGARAVNGAVSADAARCGLNALGARQYLVECLRPSSAGHVVPGAVPGPRTVWQAQVDASLRAMRAEGRWEGGMLSDALALVPVADPRQGAGLVEDTRRVATTLGLDLGAASASAAQAVMALVCAYSDAATAGIRARVPSDDRMLEDLVVRTVAPELAPRPW